MHKVQISGTGSYLPPFEVDNDTLCRYYPGKGPQWIEQKIGIRARRFGFDFDAARMREGYFDNDLAEHAASRALKSASITAHQLDLIVRITCTPEYLFFPDPACVLHRRLGAHRDCAAYTIPAGCGGLIYALKTIEAQIRSGGIQSALVVASNTPSSFINTKDLELVERNWLNAAIFGDGASALVLENSSAADKGILASYWGAWHENDPIFFPAGGSRNPTTFDNVYDHYYKMNGKAVATLAPRYFKYVIEKLNETHPFSTKEVDWFLFHQASPRALERLREELGIPRDKFPRNC